MRILVTGAAGFIGRNLCANLALRKDAEILRFDAADAPESLPELAASADFVYHLAGVNRPPSEADFQSGNADLTRRLTEALTQAGRKAPLVLASSTQAGLDNPYGRSKRQAEEAAFAYAEQTGAAAYVYRFPGVFGKWCRPNYNSVVATFCHNAAQGLPLRVDDPAKALELLYIDDLVAALIALLDGAPAPTPGAFCQVTPTHTVTLGEIAALIQGFAQSRQDGTLRGDRADAFTRKLYATYLSYLPADSLGTFPPQHVDARGSFTELLRMPQFGQISVSLTKPGITRGNHWHNTKVEKFIVVAGSGVIRFRPVAGGEVIEYPVSGEAVQVVDIPPGYTHNIQNTGESDLVLLLWAGELFDPEHPDTYFMEV